MVQNKKDIFDLSEEEFDKYFKENISSEVFDHGIEVNNRMFSSVIISLVLFGFLIKVSFDYIHNAALQFLLFFCIGALWLISINIFIKVSTEPLKKAFFKAVGIKFLYDSKLKHLARKFSKLLFRIDDMVCGKYKGYNFAVFDCIENISSHKIFFAAKINRKFSSQIFLRTKDGLADIKQNNSFFKGKNINLEDVEFAKVYKVFGEDQVESRYLLTPAFMTRLLNYNQQTGRSVQVLFSNKYSDKYNIFFYIPVKIDWFDFQGTINKIGTRQIDLTNIKEYYYFIIEIKILILIIAALKLDQDIGM